MNPATGTFLAGILTASLIANMWALFQLIIARNREERLRDQLADAYKRLTHAEMRFEKHALRKPHVSDWVD